MAIVYGLKVNLSVAMVIMVNSTALKIESLEGEESTCQATLTDLHQSLLLASNQTSSSLNMTAIELNIGSTTQYCDNIASQINTWKTKTYTESDLNEVNTLKCSVHSE